ncbi:hypothetical protein UFOVP1165_6 [uncultured Caudovirales phage]|uniref:Uncharacterized protein n=1 Tax=uncultured Caudovirales phage TaxID=2100421 RepID=A0A6J5QUA6_9CAUD|nr:hypothetical protein UFOVP1165_6 [uncultured Caudovirales phage]
MSPLEHWLSQHKPKATVQRQSASHRAKREVEWRKLVIEAGLEMQVTEAE